MVQQLARVAAFIRQVIQPHGNHADGAGHEFFGTTALAAVPLHPFHLAVSAVIKPFLQALLILFECAPRETDGVKAELEGPLADLAGK